MFQNLMNAIDIYEVCLGFDHPETADTYTSWLWHTKRMVIFMQHHLGSEEHLTYFTNVLVLMIQ